MRSSPPATITDSDPEKSRSVVLPMSTRAKRYLSTPVSPTHTDIPIIICCLVSGLCDSSAFASWQCFVSMQTGNSIFLCLGASHLPPDQPYGWLKALISVIAFVVGCWFFAQTRRWGPVTRGTLSASFFIQTVFVITAASLVQSGVVPSFNPYIRGAPLQTEEGFIERVPVALLAFQAAAQLVTSQFLGVNEVPTVVLTSVYCGLATDPKFLHPLKGNVKRDRRIAAVVVQLCGAIAGGWLVRSKAGIAGALWIAAALKLAISVSWLFWSGREEEDDAVM